MNGAETAVSQFLRTASERAGAFCAADEHVRLRYSELDRHSAGVAAALVENGIAPGEIVAAVLPRSAGLLEALIGIMRAGAAYCPIDPSAHPELTASRLRHVAARFAIGDGPAAAALGIPAITLDTAREHPAPGGLDLSRGPLPAYVLFTSGSTGRPKAVSVPHSALLNRLRWMERAMGFRADDRFLQKTAPSFDVSLWELLSPLLCGAELRLPKAGVERDPYRLHEQIELDRTTIVHFVPSAAHAYARAVQTPCSSVRVVVSSGERLTRRLAAALASRFPNASVYNLYGPTEAAIDVTAWRYEATEADSDVAIGTPIDNVELFVLDERLDPVPDREPGELFIAGACLAHGYVADPELTARRFTTIRDTSGAEKRAYRTGDEVVRDEHGVLWYRGRLDRETKINGARVDLNDVEQALRAVAGVENAVSVVEETDAGRVLTAYFVGSAAPGDVRSALTARLPQHAVPGVLRVLDVIPVDAHGKADITMLRSPGAARGEPVGDTMERAVGEAWRNVLGRPISEDANFFEDGGTSLRAVHFIAQLRERTGRELRLSSLYDHPRARDVVGALRAAEIPQRAARTRDASDFQASLWLLQQLDPSDVSMNVLFEIRVAAAVASSELERTFRTLIDRHALLRTRFAEEDGTVVRDVLPPGAPELEAARADSAYLEAVLGRRAARRPFDLAWAPLLRFAALGDQRMSLVVEAHHSVVDGYSVRLLARELADIFAGRPLPSAEECYDTYVGIEQARRANDGRAAAERQAWSDILRGGHAPVALRFLSGANTSLEADAFAFRVDETTAGRLSRFCADFGRTIFEVCLGTWGEVLLDATPADTLVVATPHDERHLGRFEHVVGPFLRTIPLALRRNEPGNVIDQVRAGYAAALRQTALSPSELARIANWPADTAVAPLMQFVFVMHPLHERVRACTEQPVATMRYDLKLEAEIDAAGIEFVLSYRRSRFDRREIERHAADLQARLACVGVRPEAVGTR